MFPTAAPAAPPQEDSFEALLLKVKAKLNAGKPAAGTAPPSAAAIETATATAADGSNKANESINSSIWQLYCNLQMDLVLYLWLN